MEVNKLIRCREDNDFVFTRPITHACQNEFLLDEEKVFKIECVDYFSDPIEQYYTICPNCGYMVLLSENELSLELKRKVELRSEDSFMLFKRNYLRSELLYWDYMEKCDKEKLARVRKRSITK